MRFKFLVFILSALLLVVSACNLPAPVPTATATPTSPFAANATGTAQSALITPQFIDLSTSTAVLSPTPNIVTATSTLTPSALIVVDAPVNETNGFDIKIQGFVVAGQIYPNVSVLVFDLANNSVSGCESVYSIVSAEKTHDYSCSSDRKVYILIGSQKLLPAYNLVNHWEISVFQ